MSDILEAAHELGLDLRAAGVIDAITMRKLALLRLPQKRNFSAADVLRIRQKTRMSQPVFALVMNVGSSTIAQWEKGHRKPSGPSARLLDVIDRKGVEALVT